jgi:hypothetical protein
VSFAKEQNSTLTTWLHLTYYPAKFQGYTVTRESGIAKLIAHLPMVPEVEGSNPDIYLGNLFVVYSQLYFNIFGCRTCF